MDLSPDEDNFQGRLLHQAALWDNVELLQELLLSGADVNARDGSLRCALHAAALAERSRCLAALCRAGAEVDAVSDEATGGKTALHISAERGHVENVTTLLSFGARLTVTDASGDTPLTLAERCGHRHAAQALRDARDALERERLAQHAALRELVTAGDVAGLKERLAALVHEAGLVVNQTPGGANTLLYVASEAGLTGAVSALLDAGADGRSHPVTKYGPLYIAAYHGHKEIVKLLLQHFPAAVQQETVEKWLPIHAACIGGHAALVTLLLEYPYPESVLNTYTDARQRRYRAAFDANARDVSGQSPLYIACTLGNLPVVEALLTHTVACLPDEHESEAPSSTEVPVTSPHRSGISLGIHAIVTKLTGGSRPAPPPEPPRVRPVRTDVSRGADSCVACCARGNHAAALLRLLAAGADANASAAPPVPSVADSKDSRRRSRSACAGRTSPSAVRDRYNDDREGPWTALAVACRLKNVQIAEILLKHGATDPTHRAARAAAANGLSDLLAKILATKAYPDPDYKLNKSLVSERVFNRRAADSALTYSALCPSVPVMINWRDLGIHADTVRISWLRLAAVHVNSRLSSESGALSAITRLELANNELRTLPPQLFTLLSIRYINVAQNKLERLPAPGDPYEEDIDPPRGRRKKHPRPCYTAPALQELYLQDNRLDELPPALFSLPSLTTLDVSNNKLRSLPPQMWAAPSLRDLNAALNHLRDLPAGEVDGECLSPQTMSPVSELSSPSSNNGFNYLKDKPSRSPSLEQSESEALDEDSDLPTVANRAGNAVSTEARRVHSWRGAVQAAPAAPPGACPLQALNLSHNQFASVPLALACRASSLTRLNMAYNCLRSMSYVTSYPTSLRQLDLSHNEITCWPSLPQLDSGTGREGDPLACYCPRGVGAGAGAGAGAGGRGGRPRSGGSVRAQLMAAACAPRRHLRLEGLRTLILSNNLLTRIQLTTDDDGSESPATQDGSTNDDDEDWAHGSSLKGKLLFPLLSMLDVSCNMLRGIPTAIHELTNLSVLNVSGNKDITDLPPQMGLLSRLWSLNASGCGLHEPLRSMLNGGKYKSADIVGYLKSVLHAATKYTRMKLMLVGQQGIGKTSLLECLRQESAIQHRRKPTDHWARRMGNKAARRNLSTVGVDVGEWTYDKPRGSRGPLTFRTWDFGGQQEYYATHQYFLSRRSLYLVVWKVTDGKKGLATALDWLRSIQARAPGSPVIMVATHYDQVANCNLPEWESPECLQRLVRSRIMGAPDADKLGLPRVMDSIEVSCNTRHNIKLLADIIYSVAFSVKPPGSKEPLLEQRIPATYLALEECVTALAAELPEPVLRHHDYKRLVTQYMQQKNHKMFRDAAELHQATMFLHENGVILHYDDATLKELYFLRPQWLCDVLAHVVTIREINPFANNGIMKVDDLAHVFKASPQLIRGEEASSLGLSLLNKFELALCWDGRILLVPPLLPAAEPAVPQLSVRSRTYGGTPRRVWPVGPQLAVTADTNRATDSPTLITEDTNIILEGRRGRPLNRLLLLTYIPCGFWARLCVRLLADQNLATAPQALYRTDHEMENDDSISKALEMNWGWKLWRRGMRLACGALTLLAVRELPARHDALLSTGLPDEAPAATVSKLVVVSEGAWCTLDVSSSSCIEIQLPAQVAVARRADGLPISGYQSISLEPNPEVLAKVLALVSDHVDLLLEDWYPSLGTRFVHTSEGRCLITRVVPCPSCLRDAERSREDRREQHIDNVAQQAFRRLELEPEAEPQPRLSQESRASDGDSGVGAESNASSRLGSVEGIVSESGPVAHAWTMEQCILSACTGKQLHCTHHNDVSLRDVAPDTLLLDLPPQMRARWEQISHTSLAGRGAFGTVLAGAWRSAAGAAPVAVKALQPVPPPPGADVAAQHAYKAAAARWAREPAAAACRAYSGLRQELGILSRLRHAHVVRLHAACAAPLALLLALAPLGALDGVIKEYRGCGARVRPRIARVLLLQIARALEYLHDRRIVYRDLKSENVLVWKMPRASEAAAAELADTVDVDVKLGDYGISRLAPPSGTKGFGGTEGFMAPEIMRYNGEEEYNEKVDCFSFGMLIYEVITGRQPFEGHEAVKEAILEGARPSLSPRELEYPCNVLETMRRCWLGAPELRPSAAALVSALAAPEMVTLQDAAACRPAPPAAGAAVVLPEQAGLGYEVWYGGGEPDRVHTILASRSHFTHHHTVRIPPDKSGAVSATAICRVDNNMWVGDSAGRITVYSIETCAAVWAVSVAAAVGGAARAVAALRPLPRLRRLALALAHGRLFLVTSDQPEPEGTFVLTELGTATELTCLAAVPTDDGFEVWAGGDSLSAYSVSEAGATSAESVALPCEGSVAALEARPGVVAGYIRGGVCVYNWNARTKQQTAKLDCSKLVPCSESLQTISDDDVTTQRCTVTALCQAGSNVFVGTAWGCIVVADGATLRPLTVFRPYEADVQAIVPLEPHKDPSEGHMLCTFGAGYRPLLQRYAPLPTNSTNQYPGHYCLLWKARHWLPD